MFMNILTSAELDYIDNLPVLFVVHLSIFSTTYLPTYLLPNIIYSAVLSSLNFKRNVRIQQITDGAIIVLRKHYPTVLEKTKYGFR